MPAKTMQELLAETQAVTSIDLVVASLISMGYRMTKKTGGKSCKIYLGKGKDKEEVLSDITQKLESFKPLKNSDSELKIGQYTIGIEAEE
jgi:hypothetical protein